MGTRTDSKMLPTVPASAISLASGPSRIFDADPSRGGRARKRSLIDLEEPEVSARLPRPRRVLQKRGGHAAIEIGAGPVVDRVPPRGAGDVREHSRGRGLPVCAGDARDAELELGREST